MEHCQRQTRIYATAANQHGAGPALSVVAALLGAGKPEVLPQHVEQSRARIQREALFDAVDGHVHRPTGYPWIARQHRRRDRIDFRGKARPDIAENREGGAAFEDLSPRQRPGFSFVCAHFTKPCL